MADEPLPRILMKHGYRQNQDGDFEVFIITHFPNGQEISHNTLKCDSEGEAQRIVRDLKNMVDSLNKHN